MDDAIILDGAVIAYGDFTKVSPDYGTRPDADIFAKLDIANNSGSLANISGIGYLWCFTVKTLYHFILRNVNFKRVIKNSKY